MMKTKSIAAAVAASLLAASAAGLAQQVVVPADSTTDGARATVAINAAGMQNQINQLASWPDGSLPWTRSFVGQTRSSCGSVGDGSIGSYSGCVNAYLDGNGQVYFVWPNYWGSPSVWQAAGYTSAAEPVTRTYAWVTAGITYGLSATVYPTTFDMNGRALNWAVRTNAW